MINHRKPLKRRTELKRGASLRRGKRLERKSWPRRKPPKRTGEDPGYRLWVKTQHCCARGMSPCFGPIDPHHAGREPGKGLKAHDHSCIALCRQHHRQEETLSGAFRDWSGARRQVWRDEQIAEHRSRYLAQEGRL